MNIQLVLLQAYPFNLDNEIRHCRINDILCVQPEKAILFFQEWVTHFLKQSNKTLHILSKEQLQALCLLVRDPSNNLVQMVLFTYFFVHFCGDYHHSVI